MSLQLLLEDFLGLMREEGELDVYLPLLLSGMGHEIVYRAQKGPRQYGVDIVSVGVDDDGRKKLFLWLVKCGDIGRRQWSTNPQDVRPSIEDTEVYLTSHVPPQYAKTPKKLVVLTNGNFRPELAQTLADFLDSWTRRMGVEASQANGSTLAIWTEKYLLDEHALPSESRVLFRRMLANVSTPEVSVRVGRELVGELVKKGKASTNSASAQRKQQLTALRAIRTALSILGYWGQREGNLTAPYKLAEYATLAIWSGFHLELTAGNADVRAEYFAVVFQLAFVGQAYHTKIEPFYFIEDAFAARLPDSLLVSERVFEETGRLGFQGYLLAFHAACTGDKGMAEAANRCAVKLCALLQTHSCSGSPCYDHQSIDVHAALLCLLATGRVKEAHTWLETLTFRLLQAIHVEKFLPLNASFHTALEIRHGYAEVTPDLISTSTFIPILALWTAALELPDLYRAIRIQVLPHLKNTTMNAWSADVGFDGLLANPGMLSQHGVGEPLAQFPENPEEFVAMLSKPLQGIPSIEESAWYKDRFPYLPILSAMHWRLQVPREMLAKQISALCSGEESGSEQKKQVFEGESDVRP